MRRRNRSRACNSTDDSELPRGFDGEDIAAFVLSVAAVSFDDGETNSVLGKQRDLALVFKDLATLRTDAPLFKKVDELRWRGPADAFASWTERAKLPRLLERAVKAQQALS